MTAILGAGISGLSAAYYALKQQKITPLVILEASNRVGGWIRSIKQPDGTVFEKGPRVIRGTRYRVLDLIEELNLTPKILPVKFIDPVAKNRYIYADNTIYSLSLNFKEVIIKHPLINRSLCSVILNDLLSERVVKDDETIYSFIERRFGKEVSEKLVAPVLCGICGGDIHKLSAKSFMTKIFEIEQTYGSIIGGLIRKKISEKINKNQKSDETAKKSEKNASSLAKRAVEEAWYTWGLEGGLEQLPQALAENITKHGVDIKMNHNCEQIIFNKNGVELILNGKTEKYSRIISSLSAKNLANLIQEQHPELSKELNSIPMVTIAVINFQFSENVLPINGFGILVPPKEEIPILGIIFDSCVVPQNSKMTVLTVMMGGAWFEKYFGKCSSEEHLKMVALEYVNKILCINEDPKAYNISILKDCIPQYVVGHSKRLTRIKDYISAHKIPLGLCGSSYNAIGVPDVILSAEEAVSNINDITLGNLKSNEA